MVLNFCELASQTCSSQFKPADDRRHTTSQHNMSMRADKEDANNAANVEDQADDRETNKVPKKKETEDSDVLLKITANDRQQERGLKNSDTQGQKTNTINDTPSCLPITNKGTRKGAPGVVSRKDKSDAPRIRVVRKKFQEKRRRTEFRAALNKLLATMRSHDQEFAQDAMSREAKMTSRLLYRTALNEDNPLFNRVELVHQAHSTIAKLREEGEELKKTLESLGGTKMAHMSTGASRLAPIVFHLGVGPLALHEVPPVVPGRTTREPQKAKTRHNSSQGPESSSPFFSLAGLLRDDRSNHMQTTETIPEPNRDRMSNNAVVPPSNAGFGAGGYSQNVLLQEGKESLWLQHQMQILEGQRLQSFSVGNLMSPFFANQHTSSLPYFSPAVQSTLQHPGILAPSSFPTPAQADLGEQQQYAQFSRIAHILGGPPHQQHQQQQREPVLEPLENPESEYHRSMSTFHLTWPPHPRQPRPGGPAP